MRERQDSLKYFIELVLAGKWEVKDNGRIWAHWERRVGWLKNPKPKDKLMTNGYYCVRSMVTEENVSTTHTVMSHRLVWALHNGLIPVGMEVNHINANKTDNRIINLELATRKENQIHAKENGLLNPAKELRHPRCVLSNNDVKEIKVLLKTRNLTQREISNIYGVRPNQISRIKNGSRRASEK